jgi:tripartite-type tricarboxylate transporter receptor subunit TctC
VSLKAVFAMTLWICAIGTLPHAHAQGGYPTRPVRIIVPFAPGGGTDIIARIMAPRLAESLGQQVIVDNRPGGGTLIGAELAARAAPDGYTLFMGLNGTMAINPSLHRKLPYDPVKDFAPVTLVAIGPNVLVVHPSLPVKTVAELIMLARKHPNKLSYASSGIGGAPHLAGEMLKSMAGIELVHIPYKGAAPATTDLLAGHVQVMFAGLGPALPHVKSGRLRALAVAGARRTPALPETPTIAEHLKGFEASSWFAVFVPAGTPKDTVARLHTDIVSVMARQDLQQPLLSQGYEPVTGTPVELAQLVREDTARWARVIREAGITAD